MSNHATGVMNGNFRDGIYTAYMREVAFTASGAEMNKRELKDKVISLLLEIKRTKYERTIERCEDRLAELMPEYDEAFGPGSYQQLYSSILGVG